MLLASTWPLFRLNTLVLNHRSALRTLDGRLICVESPLIWTLPQLIGAPVCH
jgi:hypothetical protein